MPFGMKARWRVLPLAAVPEEVSAAVLSDLPQAESKKIDAKVPAANKLERERRRAGDFIGEGVGSRSPAGRSRVFGHARQGVSNLSQPTYSHSIVAGGLRSE